MAISREEFEAIARQLAENMGIKTKPSAHRLRIVGENEPPVVKLNELQRDLICARINDLGDLYWLKWLIRQETAHVFGVFECLSDDELSALLKKMERGRECIIEGIGFDEAGLVRGLMDNSGEGDKKNE